MNLPNGNLARLGSKLERYCLNIFHHKGKEKAALFRNRLGIILENKEVLESAILTAATSEKATLRQSDQHGNHYNVRFFMTTDIGESWVLSCWIIRTGEDFPRLTNAYPVRK